MIVEEKETRILESTTLVCLITFFNQFVRVSNASRVMATTSIIIVEPLMANLQFLGRPQ